MGNPRAMVLGVVFTLLLGASILTINREDGVSAAAWALLGLTAAFAAATVIAFFTKEEVRNVDANHAKNVVSKHETEGQKLPEPADAGFDVPIL